MSWGTCNSGSNNIHFGFPPLMTDGRNYTSWQPNAVLNNKIRKQENITTNGQYRKYLTDNASAIMQFNAMESCDQCCACPPRYGDNQPQTGTPYLYKSCGDSTAAFGYENSDLKTQYLTSQQLQSRMTAPKLSQYQYIQQQIHNPN